MNILIIHNYYSTRGGEESVVEFQKQLLESKGHHVFLYTRHYNEMNNWLLGKSWGTFTSIFNRKSRKDLNKIICDFQPEVAILHNLFPIISPSIIPYLSKRGIRVFQVVHNYRMFCPIGILYNKDQICHKCLNVGRELNCTINKCNDSFLQSLSYSIRSYFVRKLNFYKNVDRFIVLSQFQKSLFIENGFREEKIEIIPNAYTPKCKIDFSDINLEEKLNIGFVGRLTQEKGFFDFVELARQTPEYNFCVAGDYSHLPKTFEKPTNLTFDGLLNAEKLYDFYKKCRVILFLSHWYEGFPMVILESMQNYTPLIVTNLGVMPEIIQHGKNGFVVSVGDLQSIRNHIVTLFSDTEIYQQMAILGKQKCEEIYSVDNYYEKLMIAILN